MAPRSIPPFDPSDSSDAVVREHADAARRLARHLVFDRDHADDVAQEAMRVALVRPAPEGHASTQWLRGIVRNVARAFVRRDGKRGDVEARAALDLETRTRIASLDDPAVLVLRAEEHRGAIDAVLRLAEPYRATLILRFLEDLEPSEVARRQGVPIETVRSRVRRGLDLVRADLDARHGGNRRRWLVLLAPVPSFAPPPASRPSPVPNPALVGAGAFAVKKLSVVALVLVLGVGAWRFLLSPTDVDTPRESERLAGLSSDAPSGDPALAAVGRPLAGPDALPPPVAFDAPGVIDRDRDIHGVVVREDGTPVAGALVSAMIPAWSGARLIGSDSDDEGRANASTRTASDGSFALRFERGAATRFRVVAAGFAHFDEDLVGAGDRMRIVLYTGVRLVVRVKDARGAAVSNATVVLRRMGGPTTWGYVRTRYRREHTTDVDGKLVFDDLPAGSGGTWTFLEVDVPGVGEAWHKQVEIPERGESMYDVVLPTIRVMRGVVTDAETKQPLSNAVVGIGWQQVPRATTNAEGTYTLSVFDGPGSPHACAEAAGHVWQERRVEETVDFALVPAATLTGRLLDEKGSPIAGAALAANGTYDLDAPTGRAVAVSAADGRFTLVGLSASSASELWIEAAGFGRRGLAISAFGDTRARDLGDIVLTAGRRVEGRTVDQDGQPVAGVYVGMTGASVEQTRFWTGTERTLGRLYDARVTDDLGRFRFADIAPGSYRLDVQARGQAKQERKIAVGAADFVGLHVVLRSGRTLVVHVRGPDGAPLSWTSVEVRLPDGSSHREEAMGASEVGFVVPDADVQVAVVGLQPGQRAPEAQLVPRGTDDVTITLLPADEWEITGSVLDADGAPIVFASVDATRADARSRHRAQTDQQGKFRVLLRGGDRSTLTLTGQTMDPRTDRTEQGAFEADPVEVTRGTKDVVIRTRRVPTGQTLRVIVQDPDGRPLAGIPIYLQLPDYGPFLPAGTVDADGVVEFKNLVGSALTVGRGSGLYTMGENWVDPFVEAVPAGQTVVFRFVAGTIVRGVVIGVDGAPVPRVAIHANEGQRGLARYTHAHDDGRFAISLDPKRHVPLVLSVSIGGGDQPLLRGSASFDALPSEFVTIRLTPPSPDAK